MKIAIAAVLLAALMMAGCDRKQPDAPVAPVEASTKGPAETCDCGAEEAPTGGEPNSGQKGGEKAPAADSKSAPDSTPTTRKGSCRCGQLTATYTGPDPERITMCHCNSCQMRTGTMFSVQARFPRDKVKLEGKSTTWTFPDDSKPVTYHSCDSGGATYHFCPVCGTTVYWDIAAAPDVVGIAIGTLTDPTFPPPKIGGFEAYAHPWSMNAAELQIPRLQLGKK